MDVGEIEKALTEVFTSYTAKPEEMFIFLPGVGVTVMLSKRGIVPFVEDEAYEWASPEAEAAARAELDAMFNKPAHPQTESPTRA